MTPKGDQTMTLSRTLRPPLPTAPVDPLADGWVDFASEYTRSRVNQEPRVVINPLGHISISRPALALIGSPDYIRFRYHAERGAIGIVAAKREDKHRYKLSNPAHGGGRQASVGKFLRTINYQPTITIQYTPVVEADMLVLEDGRPYVRST
jgi:hypothetical protein